MSLIKSCEGDLYRNWFYTLLKYMGPKWMYRGGLGGGCCNPFRWVGIIFLWNALQEKNVNNFLFFIIIFMPYYFWMNDSYIRSFHKDCLSTVKYSKNIILLQKIWTAKVKLCDKGRFTLLFQGMQLSSMPSQPGTSHLFSNSTQN